MANNITPVPPDKIGECHNWREWFSRIYLLLNGSVAGSVPINHNALSGLQGGLANEEYHLSNAEHTGLTGLGDTTLHYHASDRNLANATGVLANAAYLNSTNTHTVNGDQEILSLDPSKMRTGTWSDPAKLYGSLYTLAGGLVMFYQSHNVAIDPATGNFLGRDETDACFLLIRTEAGAEVQYYAPSAAAGTVPIWTTIRGLDYATGSIILLGDIVMSGKLAVANGVDRLSTTGAAVFVNAAAPPTVGQVLTATTATNATWQTPSGGGGGVTSFNTRTGAVTLTSADVTTALTFTPYNATNPSGYTSNTGTVTSASVVSANGFAGTVATATTTPAITISTSITGLLKGNGTAISAATIGTDYINLALARQVTSLRI